MTSHLSVLHLRFLVLACFVLNGCIMIQDAPADSWPPLGSPCKWMDIETAQLTPANASKTLVELDPYFSAQTPVDFYVDDTLRPLTDRAPRAGVEVHIYPHMTVEGHYFGTGTYVFDLPDDGLFYLWGDDYMGHFDGMVGPFAGDPRIELPRAASPTSVHPGEILAEENCD